jgi:putative sterol carrier protein
MYSGDLNVTVAAAQGRIKSTGDRMAALRMLPVMFRTINHYKAARALFFSKVPH